MLHGVAIALFDRRAIYLACHQVNGRKVQIEHPTQPKSLVVSSFLFLIVMTNAEIIGDIKQLRLIVLHVHFDLRS